MERSWPSFRGEGGARARMRARWVASGPPRAPPSDPPVSSALLLHRYVVARVIWADMLSIAVTYFITLCLFPGLESEIRHCVLGEWLPILVMAVFNLSDFVGKVGVQTRGPGWRDWTQAWRMGPATTEVAAPAAPPRGRPSLVSPGH